MGGIKIKLGLISFIEVSPFFIVVTEEENDKSDGSPLAFFRFTLFLWRSLIYYLYFCKYLFF